MSEATRRWIDAATGVGFVVPMTVALALPGQPPKADDPLEKVTAILIGHRTAFLASGYIAGLAAMAYLWFLGSVSAYLRPARQDGATGAARGAGVFAIALLLLGMAMFSGVAFVAARVGTPAPVRAFTDTGNTAIETSKFGFALFLLAVSRAGAAGGQLPRWLTRRGFLAVPVIVLSAVSLFVDRGPFQFGGAIDAGGAIPALVWIVALSAVMMRKAVTP